MEEILKNMGISKGTIRQMEEICPNINELTEKEILEKVQILKDIKCDDIQIRNIISSNASYLDRTNEDVKKLIQTMQEFGFNTLNILFDGNPYILNLDSYEIKEYINSRQEKGESLEDIVDDMDSNPIIFQEI